VNRGIRVSVAKAHETNRGKETTMKLTVTESVSLDGVMQGLGGPDEDRRGGFERGGWQIPLSDQGVGAFLNDVCARADAFLFGGGRTRSSPAPGAS
jgi:hypothetical protein